MLWTRDPDAKMTIAARQPRKLSIDEFLAFYATRPDEERWQLIDGVALKMTPPFPIHQRLARNLERLLNDALATAAPHLSAEQRIGIELPAFSDYRPEPDVLVLDFELPTGRRYVDRFYLVAEILSDSDDERVDLKRALYRGHEHNRAILLVSQDRQEVQLDLRRGDVWISDLLRGPDAALNLPDFGFACRLGDIYRNTPVPHF